MCTFAQTTCLLSFVPVTRAGLSAPVKDQARPRLCHGLSRWTPCTGQGRVIAMCGCVGVGKCGENCQKQAGVVFSNNPGLGSLGQDDSADLRCQLQFAKEEKSSLMLRKMATLGRREGPAGAGAAEVQGPLWGRRQPPATERRGGHAQHQRGRG